VRVYDKAVIIHPVTGTVNKWNSVSKTRFTALSRVFASFLMLTIMNSQQASKVALLFGHKG
jgi:hypothetical protein